MKDFTITLTATSEKKFRLRAGSREEASLLVNAILENSDLLDFTDEDVNAVDTSRRWTSCLSGWR